MTIDVTCNVDSEISLEEFVDAAMPYADRLGDEDILIELAPKIQQLARNRTFFSDVLMKYLGDSSNTKGKSFDITFNAYASHVVLIHLDPKAKLIVRANIWPGVNDYVYKINNEKVFSYNYPHDHSFSFLTVGYLGPGYVSDYYETDPDEIVGYPGEKVTLRFKGRSQLTEGRSLVYRAHKDVHVQFPPESTSVSLNLFGNGLLASISDQYIFDIKNSCIAKIANSKPLGVLTNLAVHLGGENARDFVTYLAMNHPIESVRFEAIRTLAKIGTDEERLTFLKICEGSSSAYLASYGKQCLESLGK